MAADELPLVIPSMPSFQAYSARYDETQNYLRRDTDLPESRLLQTTTPRVTRIGPPEYAVTLEAAETGLKSQNSWSWKDKWYLLPKSTCSKAYRIVTEPFRRCHEEYRQRRLDWELAQAVTRRIHESGQLKYANCRYPGFFSRISRGI